MKKKILFTLLLSLVLFSKANVLDSLKLSLKNETSDSIKFITYSQIIIKYIYFQIDSALPYLEKENDFLINNHFDKATHDIFLLEWYNNYGIYSSRKGLHDKAISFYKKALELSRVINNKASEATELNNIANIYYLQGNYLISLDYHLKALSTREDIKDTAGIAMSLGNIGLIHESRKEYYKAIKKYKKSKHYFTLLDAKRPIAWCNRVIGIAYLDQKNYSKAKQYLNLSLQQCRDLHNDEDIKFCLINLASIYIQKNENSQNNNELDSSNIYLKEIALLQEKQLNKRIQINYLLFQSKIALSKQQFQTAIQSLDSAESILKTIDFKTELKNVYLQKSTIYEQKQDYKQSLYFFKKFKTLSDTLFNTEKEKEIGQKEAWFEYNQQLKVEKLKNENKQKSLVAEKKIQVLISLLIGLLLIVVSFIFIYHLKKKIKITNALENEKTQLIEKYSSLELAYSSILENLNQIQEKSQVQKATIEKALPNWIKELSKREIEVLSCLAIGLTDKEIENKLFISVSTVRTHCQRIYGKLLVKNRIEAANLAREYNLI